MSEMAIYHATQWAHDRPTPEIKARIRELEEHARRPSSNHDFGDMRLRHKMRTELQTLRDILEGRAGAG